jgi:hypothetical protein
MSLSTIEQGEELLKRANKGDVDAFDKINAFLWSHASELLQMARERHNLMQHVIDLAADHGYKDFAAYLNKLDRGEDA